MNRIIYIIICSILFSTPFHGFQLNKDSSSLGRSNGDFPDSNGIIDIEHYQVPPSNMGTARVSYVWVGTGVGLGKIALSPVFLFSGFNSSNLPVGGSPALFSDENIVIVSGVTQEYVATTGSYEPKGTGIGYSMDNGISWEYMSQPICEDCTGYENIDWGNQELSALAVTTDINNVSYDVGVKENYVYASSWAGGLRRFDYTIENSTWEIIPLPMDDQDSLICNLIDEDNFELNPRDPNDGGNHNHKGFSVLGTDNYLWVGTANGINRGTINGDCIDWYHQTVENGLSGDWVIGIENQLTDTIDRVWAITWSAGEGQYNSISYTDNQGVSWNDVEYFSNQNIKIYNLDFSGESIYAASEEGLFYSEDLIHWEKVARSWVDSITGDTISDETVYSIRGSLVGTGDGLIAYSDYNTTIYRFWNNTATSESENHGFSVYPNPFFINENEEARFIYYNSNSLESEIDIYDFSMNHVINLSERINIENESTIIWDGRNKLGTRVVNGIYFCKLTIGLGNRNDKTYWTKLLVIN